MKKTPKIQEVINLSRPHEMNSDLENEFLEFLSYRKTNTYMIRSSSTSGGGASYRTGNTYMIRSSSTGGGGQKS